MEIAFTSEAIRFLIGKSFKITLTKIRITQTKNNFLKDVNFNRKATNAHICRKCHVNVQLDKVTCVNSVLFHIKDQQSQIICCFFKSS